MKLAQRLGKQGKRDTRQGKTKAKYYNVRLSVLSTWLAITDAVFCAAPPVNGWGEGLTGLRNGAWKEAESVRVHYVLSE